MMEVKKAVDDIKDSVTLKRILGCLLATGNFLNGKIVSDYLPCLHYIHNVIPILKHLYK